MNFWWNSFLSGFPFKYQTGLVDEKLMEDSGERGRFKDGQQIVIWYHSYKNLWSSEICRKEYVQLYALHIEYS